MACFTFSGNPVAILLLAGRGIFEIKALLTLRGSGLSKASWYLKPPRSASAIMTDSNLPGEILVVRNRIRPSVLHETKIQTVGIRC